MGIGSMVKFERYYIKTRGRKIGKSEADVLGIKRVYNYTSDVDYMDMAGLERWSSGLYDSDKGEGIIIESAFREIEGVQLYIMSCIVFFTVEQCNLYYIRYQDQFKLIDGFSHLLN